ncbi:protein DETOXIFICATION 27-like [Magnolia sinica]|uniref:protein DETOXIFICATION 27-like n=1 Tax=Magnolia sinica TaxID=86752 RepID=UPI00265B25BD|nr:protein DETOXIFICATION 27-like [Magnolia sinica]
MVGRKETVPLLLEPEIESHEGREEEGNLIGRVKDESKKLWKIAGPTVIGRVVLYSMTVVTIAFSGHLGNAELAAMSLASTVLIGLTYGVLLGMASALETLCGQAFGARQFSMLGIYLQRSWIVLFLSAILLLPLYIFTTPILKLAGMTDEIATLTGAVAIWVIPQHFAFAFNLPLDRFLQCQRKNAVPAWVGGFVAVIHVLISWLLVYKLDLGLFAVAMMISFSWSLNAVLLFTYTVCGGCPLTWSGFSWEAFSGLWEFIKLSAASGVMICLENWYYRVLILMAGYMKNAETAVDALSICMNINSWQLMIPFSFFAAIGVRVANELGAGNGKAAKFATIIAVGTSTVIGAIFFALILGFHDKFALIYTSSDILLKEVDKLSILLAFTIFLNSVQPILSGVAVGSGWQAYVAYINIGCYYFIGLPAGILMAILFNFGVVGIWSGMIGGTLIQTLILAIITIRSNWDMEAEKARIRLDKYGGRNLLEANISKEQTIELYDGRAFYVNTVGRKETVPLLLEPEIESHEGGEEEEEGNLIGRVKDESKKLWQIGGPAIFSRIAMYSMIVVTIAFSGHLGNPELAAMSIASTVLIGLNYGLLMLSSSLASGSKSLFCHGGVAGGGGGIFCLVPGAVQERPGRIAKSFTADSLRNSASATGNA